MHLTALVEHPGHVCCRYRLLAFRPFLETAGHTLELRPLPRRWWSRWAVRAWTVRFRPGGLRVFRDPMAGR